MGEEEIFEEEEVGEEEEEVEKGNLIKRILGWILVHGLQILIAALVSAVVAIVVISQVKAGAGEKVYARFEVKPKPDPYAVLKLDPFRLNTADIDEPHFIRIEVALAYEAGNMKLLTELNARRAQIRDIILRILRRKKKEDLDEPSEIERLKEEIKKEINTVLKNGEIKDVYYEEFVIS